MSLSQFPAACGALPLAVLALLTSGCVGLGSNIEGSFSCRAPKGDCAPSQVIDERATEELGREPTRSYEAAQRRAGAASGDAARTAERTLRIVFPAHVDEAGTLHDEAIAWAVVERPQWASALRAPDGANRPSTMRQLRRQLKAAQRSEALAPGESSLLVPQGDADRTAALPWDTAARNDAPDGASATTPPLQEPGAPVPPDAPLFPFASPLSLPSPAAEAEAGAHAPAAEGFDMTSPQHVRTPRPSGRPLQFPSLEAIDAAKAKKPGSRRSPAEQTTAGSNGASTPALPEKP